MSDETGHSIPVPQGDYVPATRHGSLIFSAGMTPRREGTLIRTGVIPRNAVADDYVEALELACANALAAMRDTLRDGESITAILSLTVYLATEEGFDAHSRFADVAARYLVEELGLAGRGSRCAIGVASLPGNAPVEIQITAAV